MRHHRRMLPLLLALASAAAAAPADLDPASAAVTVLDDLLAGRFADVEARFDPKMRGALPPGALARTWAEIGQDLGALHGRGAPVVSRAGVLAVADVPADFARGPVTLRLAFDEQCRLAGLRVLPPVPGAGPLAPAPQPPDQPPYAKGGEFTERDVTAGAPGWPLPGTLTLPVGKGPFPAVVLVHGSGPHDRDETVGGVKPFRDLAVGLASRGIAVLRYEKRTRAHAGRFTADPALATLDAEIVDDAVAGIRLLAETPEVDPRRVVVVGHSLGAMVLPRVAARAPALAGLAGLATGARPLDAMMRDQLDHLATLLDRGGVDRAALEAELERIRLANAADPAPHGLFLGAPASWWKEALALDPPTEFARTMLPLLFLQGGRDYQTTSADLAALETALRGRPNVIFRRHPRLNHLLVAGDGPSSPAEYASPAHVAPEVIEDLAAFVRAR
jgi:uncharacterized protein